jgi:glycosyltransferase involved in cell wall biosynthesis
MRILIDMQAAQGESRDRGIGRVTVGLAEAMVRAGRGHDFVLLLNGAHDDSARDIAAQFAPIVSAGNIKIWNPPSVDDGPEAQAAAETDRLEFIHALRPDVVHLTHGFQGYCDRTVASVDAGRYRLPTAVTFYDLIPLVYPDVYLSDEEARAWYMAKLENLKRADLLLAISASSRQEAIDILRIEPDRVVNVSCASAGWFAERAVTPDEKKALQQAYGLTRPFVMCTSGADARKNNQALIEAFALLPGDVRTRHQLVIVCSMGRAIRDSLAAAAKEAGLAADELILTGLVPEADLISLYNLAEVFVFPSLHEGFGMPMVEAMACGVPVIAADNTSMPEIVNRKDALFCASDVRSIAQKVEEVLVDSQFREDLKSWGLQRAKAFTFEGMAGRALSAIEGLRRP